MATNIQRNVGNRVYRDFPALPFIVKVWQLDIENIQATTKCNLPRPVRRLLVSFPEETLRRLDMFSGSPPSRLATAAAGFSWATMETGTYGLLQAATGRWEKVDSYGKKMNRWQKVLALVHLRKSVSLGDGTESTNQAFPTQRRGLDTDETSFAEQLMHLLCSNIRSWVTGIVIHDTWVTFWYADRMGIVVSSRFNCVAQPNLLSLAGLAIGANSRKGLGISSLLSFQIPTDVAAIETDIKFALANFDLPSPEDGEGNKIDGAISFGDTNWDVPDVVIGQIVGRGTTVLPVRATSKAASQRFGGLRDSVLKMAWPSYKAPVEDAIVRRIRKRLSEDRPDMLAHVTDLKCSLTMTMHGMDLPRVSLFVMEESRVLRVQLLERYAPLQAICSAKDFKICFTDVVRAHYWVYTTSGILHRDISADNIMIRYAGTQQRGVLVDWDLAGPETLPSQKPATRRGTVPFLSSDFYASWWRGEHHYRHDLEAFMNLFAWFCACFDPQTHSLKRDNVAIWYKEHDEGHALNKRHLRDYYSLTMVYAHPEYRELADDSVVKLGNYFAKVTGAMYSDLSILHRLERGQRWGSWIEVDPSNEEIETEFKATSKNRDDAITFEGFMACITD